MKLTTLHKWVAAAQDFALAKWLRESKGPCLFVDWVSVQVPCFLTFDVMLTLGSVTW